MRNCASVSMRQALSMSALCAFLAGCGGGGGSGSSGGGSPISITVSTTHIARPVNTADEAPTAIVQIAVTGQTAAQLYVTSSATHNGVASAATMSSSAGYVLTVSFKSPAAVGIGVYNDTVTLNVCNDASCTSPVGNSPQTITVQYTVTAVPQSLDAVSFQITPTHTGVMNFSSAALPTASKWSVTFTGVPSYALIAEGKVFVTVSFGNTSELVALDQVTGAVAWGPVPISGVSNAAYDSGTVFLLNSVFGFSGTLEAFDAATGALKWSTPLPGQYAFFHSVPTAANGYVLVAGEGSGGTLYAVKQATGVIAWTQEITTAGNGPPVVTADSVYVTQACSAYDFNLSTGAAVWSDNISCLSAGGGTSILANGLLYAPVFSDPNHGATMNPQSGTLVGTFVADVSPAIALTTGYFLSQGTLKAVDLASNAVAWSFAGDGHLVTAPIVVNNYVFIGSSNGNLYGLDAASGAQLWQMAVGEPILGGPTRSTILPFTGMSAGDGLLIVPTEYSVIAYTLSTSP